SRVGASDNLARGRSTFMVEMVETAAILAQATERSFVILDEVGRGTSTYDGLALAWAVAEAIHETNRCRCLFATHYHELTRLADTCPALSLHHVRAKEWKGDLVLLHEVAEGAADRSYGLAVAKLAGVPRDQPLPLPGRHALSRAPSPCRHLPGALAPPRPRQGVERRPRAAPRSRRRRGGPQLWLGRRQARRRSPRGHRPRAFGARQAG